MLKDESEASEEDQTDNVGNVALYVTGLHGSGDKSLSPPPGFGGGKGSPGLPYSI